MTRKEYSQGSIQIAFGYDSITGYFISVYDARLQVNKEDGTDFDDIRYAISPDGSGAYLAAHTGSQGIGKRVSHSAMEKLWESYEVGDEGMRLLAEKRGSL